MRPDVRAVSSLLLAVSLLLAGAPARASQPPPSCNCAPTAELTALRDRIAAAPDLASAQEMAVAPVERARSVVAKLGWISPSLRDAERRMAFNTLLYGEFDPGSERTLAAWMRHASLTNFCV